MHFFKNDWIENAFYSVFVHVLFTVKNTPNGTLGCVVCCFYMHIVKQLLPLKLLYGIFFALNYFSMCITLWRTLQTLYRSFARRSASASLCIPPRCSSDWLGPTARLGPPTSRPFHGCGLTRFRSSPPHKGTGDLHPSSFQRISILLEPQNKFDSWP